MMRRHVISAAVALTLTPALLWAQAKPGAAKNDKSKAPAPVPQAPKAMAKTANPSDGIKRLPPFFGFFGSEEIVAKVGFRSRPGSYIDYAVESNDKRAGGEHGFRFAEVGPAVSGARWIEMTALSPGMYGQGLRMLARGEKSGNIERLIARAGGTPPMEFPLEAISLEAAAGVGMSADMMGPAKIVGKETITTPLGKFETDHWVVDLRPRPNLEFWITQDEKVPFTGIVKMLNEQGLVVATKTGTDAQATIPIPPTMQ